MILEKLIKYLDEGRKYGASSYNITAHFMEALVEKMESDRTLIEKLKSRLSGEVIDRSVDK